ncbi:MAG: hypothetical protein NTV49_10795 [Kiritimatiellaeota bacterium]|nr:hypothetical protein [Kiritimatiellota bacterium]
MKVSEILPRGWVDLLDAGFPKLGIGFDVATTTKKKSNPSAIALVQQVERMVFARLVVRWKSKDPAIAAALFGAILDGVAGKFAVRAAIDATSEKFFAVDFRRKFAGRCSVRLVVASEGLEYRGEKMIYKAYTGNLLCNQIEDSLLALPAEAFIRNDFRLVVRDRGTFDAEVDENGGHGDVFDAVKLGLLCLLSKGGPVQAAAAGNGGYRARCGSMGGHRLPGVMA